jgi:FtsP/CotA-like multicopper oxidase with cupredoxin domain
VRVLKQRKSKREWNLVKSAGVAIALLTLLLPLANYVDAAPPAPLPPGTINPMTIPKYVNQLTDSPPVYQPINVYDPVTGDLIRQEYTVHMEDDINGQPILQQILPAGFPKTRVWGYAGTVYSADNPDGVYSVSAPGASFEAIRGVPSYVTWVNNIDKPNMFPVDPTLHWANPTDIPMEDAMDHAMMGMSPTYPSGYDGTVSDMNPEGWDAQSIVPAVPHLHGGEVSSWYDGGPNAWFTESGLTGPTYSLPDRPEDLIGGVNSVLYKYPNEQPATTLWYHDHALGITRTNVLSGLAGFYLLRDPVDPIAPLLPSGKYEVPLVIQDRIFNTNGSFYFYPTGINPEHPYWVPEFFGNTIMVNGLVWPNMNVDQGIYRFRLLDGSNARFYTLSFSNGMPFTVIGSDGGYLKSAATVHKLTVAPGERYDIIVDFRGLPAGTKVIMTNTAKAPFPTGTPADVATVGQIMQFEVTGVKGPAPSALPAILNSNFSAGFPSLAPAPPANRRILTLTEVMGAGGPLEILLDGQKWSNPVSEIPVVGSTEEWVIVNPTADTHPIHLHLVQFQLISRQMFNVKGYLTEWYALNAGLSENTMMPGTPPYSSEPQDVASLGKYLRGPARPAAMTEQGWKDTIQMNPGEVTIIRVKFAPIDDADGQYSFDPTSGPGYVWHCHIIDHEDNEMMRPYILVETKTT